MNVTDCLCCFAMRQVGGEGAEVALRLLKDQFSDRSQALNRALLRANERAWKALEVCLAGEGLFSVFNSASEKALRTQVKDFIDKMPLPDTTARPRLKLLILAEVRDARKNGLLTGKLQPEEMAQQVGAFAAFASPQDTVAAEKKLMIGMARTMQKAGYEKLAWLLAQPARAEDSVLATAAQFYFRLEVERDERLAHSLQLSALEGLAASQASAFSGMGAALDTHGERLESVLAGLHQQLLAAVGEVKAQVRETGQALGAQIEEVKALQSQVLELMRRLDMKGQPLRAGHSLSIHNDRERAAVKEMLQRFRSLPMGQQDANPDLVSDLGKLQVAAGDFSGAKEAFQRAARLSPLAADQAEAHHNAYRAALEQGDLDQAMRELLQAVTLDPERFAPFPVDKYEALRVLGAGGFGVTFLCRHKLSRGQVAVKSLFAEELDRDVAKVLEEATTLDHLKHHSIVGLRDCGYVDRAQSRPYLVMEYFDGATLEHRVKQGGCLSIEGAMDLAERIGEALQAAHGMSILHRDIKPANVLVRQEGAGFEVRVIDFGLAMRSERLESAGSTLRQGRTIMGTSIAGTLGYAAPEQLGKLPGVRVGPQADVFGFGKTLAFALFGITEPGLDEYDKLPKAFAGLLSRCMAYSPEKRPRHFGEVLAELKACRMPAAVAVPPPVPTVRPVEMAILVDEIQPAHRPPPRDDRHDYDDRDRDREHRSPRHRSYNDNYDYRHLPPGTTPFGTRLVHALLALFFGSFGIHKFAQGNASAGMTRPLLLFCTCFLAGIALFPINIIEAIIYLTKSDEDYWDAYYRLKRPWF